MVALGNTLAISRYADHEPLAAEDPFIRAELDAMRRADGFIFVVDARPIRAEASQVVFFQFKRDLVAFGRDPDDCPVVFQVNHPPPPQEVLSWDPVNGYSPVPQGDFLPLPMAWVRDNFSTRRCAYIETSAHLGVGTTEAVVELVRLIVEPAL